MAQPYKRESQNVRDLIDLEDVFAPIPAPAAADSARFEEEGEAPAAEETKISDDLLQAADATDTSDVLLNEESWEAAAALTSSDEGAESGARTLSVGTPSKPLLGRLPLARIIPQDVHSVMDYLDAGAVMAGAALSDCPRAQAASLLIGGAGVGASSLTDYRLSLAKVIPIEAHETIDYAFGVSAIAAPFLLGYRKTAPVVAALHVAIGLGTILASLFTDYRAYRGVGGAARDQ
jgi:hypothetical protein